MPAVVQIPRGDCDIQNGKEVKVVFQEILNHFC